jgi:hypothetical protein
MRSLAVGTVALLVILLAGCNVGNPCRTVCNSDGAHSIIIFDALDDITLFTDDLTIKEIGLVENTLYLKVQYSGGCRDHEFELYGMSVFLESDPPQASVYFSHNANGDDCEARITSGLEFSLVPLKRAYQRVYHDGGPMLLRIYGPGASDPIQPLIVYAF